MPPKSKCHIGERFGPVTVVGEGPKKESGGVERNTWILRCVCGELVERFVCNAKKHRACPKCCNRKREKHGHLSGGRKAAVPEYGVWVGMLKRCNSPDAREYPRYGGRGIRVCDRWFENFADFLLDMGSRPSPRHQIDRIDNNAHYEPGNCRWVLPVANMANRRSNHRIEFQGKNLCVAEWARELGLKPAALHGRLRRHPIEVALGVPPITQGIPLDRSRDRRINRPKTPSKP